MPISAETKVGDAVLRTITLAAGGRATVAFHRMPNDDEPVSWVVRPAAAASVQVEYSLRPDGDAWVGHDSSPFDAAGQDTETNPVARLRFTAVGGAVVVDVLVSQRKYPVGAVAITES